MINGKLYDWESITVGLPYGTAIAISGIDYDDELAGELAYGKGAAPVGYGNGNYTASAKITLLRDEFNKLLDFARSQGQALYRLPLFPITVSYANDGERTRTDEIRGCKFTKAAHKGAQGDTKLEVELEILVTGKIIRDGVSPI
ncbi:hypothetical protein [Paenibacillus tyrfis]|uniref:Uncharacterized protein n=1 Tax=Paenibacillus tyrfis TaxID=1501230 RepID=A0A081NYA4_9BACL|nr:hypothetical protein [Paenibacillus tyrfis]KEQ23427.1 hypothetical protein ET33_16505 [Paenibacillus tyrfis]